MNPFKPLAAVAAVLAVALVATPAAAFTGSTSTNPPTAGVLLAYDTPQTDPLTDAYECVHGSGTAVDLGQTFRTAAPFVLDKITVKVHPLTDVASEAVTLRVGSFTDAADAEMNEVLQIASRALPAGLATGETVYLTFDLVDLALEANRQYGFLFGFTGGGDVNDARLAVFHVGGDAYAAGTAIESAAAFDSALPADLAFYLQGTAGTDGEALLLHGGRFRVTATWKTSPTGPTGQATPNPLTDASGTFWFFNANNTELLVKVHDACVDPFQRFWVFIAGLTNVEVEVRVLDTWADVERVYSNPLHTPFVSVQDTSAFATCGATAP